MQPALFQCLLGMECQDFTMVAADQTATKSIFILKNDEDKLLPLSDHLIMGINGEPGDIMQFAYYINNNLALYKIKNGYELDTEPSVHFTRKTLSDAYVRFRQGIMNRKKKVQREYDDSSPFLLNVMMGGWDQEKGGQLFVMDSMGTCVRVPFAAHGIAGLCAISILEFHYTRDMTEAQAYEVLQMCVREIHERLFLNLPNFQVKVISKDGISTLPVISPPIMNH